MPADYAAGAAFWQSVANEYTVKTRLMWHDGWFRDYDSTTNEWSTQQDTMHLAPVFCGVADRGQLEQLRPFLAQPPMHSSGWAPLSWPPVVMTLVGAATAAQMPLDAAELAYRFIDASYRSIDRREPDEYGGLPGVTREYRRTVTAGKWGEIDYINTGIEGSGYVYAVWSWQQEKTWRVHRKQPHSRKRRRISVNGKQDGAKVAHFDSHDSPSLPFEREPTKKHTRSSRFF